jgi:hypothetical protein
MKEENRKQNTGDRSQKKNTYHESTKERKHEKQFYCKPNAKVQTSKLIKINSNE